MIAIRMLPAFFALACCVEFPTSAAETTVFGYFPEWSVYDRQYFVKHIETSGSAAKLNVLAYAFAKIGDDLTVALADAHADCGMAYAAANSVDGVADPADAGVLRGSFNQLRKLKLLHPRLKIVISVGGWTFSDKFSDMALSDATRKAFAASCIERFIAGNFADGLHVPGIFDGIDIDWEFPGSPGKTPHFRPEDSRNFTALLTELRAQLDQRGASDGKHYSLSVALSASASAFAKIELGRISASLDHLNLMAYDFHGAWEPTTGFHAALFGAPDAPQEDQRACGDYAVRAYLAAGVPAAKINLGVPFYGRGWKGVAPGPRNDGLHQSGAGGAASGSENGIADYRVLALLESSYQKFRDPITKACWLYSPTTQIFWNYDDPTALRDKLDYIAAQHLGGVMLWELSGDDANGSLINALRGGVPPPSPPQAPVRP